ncbi:YigZ family protein [Nocardioides sp.]|uniref:YigZ family protein n=1 Tax=Nocardioides sp. TaxID=35761 RepID=UPI003D0D7004
MSVEHYLVPAGEGVAEIEVKRSRFRALVVRVEDEDAARAVVERSRRVHWDARHHCSAFVIGPDARLQRSSDDGEPAGTAGAPMLEVLRGRGVCDVVVVVTRWFGGVLLGAGGLVRAYADAVRAGLDDAGTLTRQRVWEQLLILDHAEAGRVEGELRQRGFHVLDAAYADRVTLRLGTPAARLGELGAMVAELTAGSAAPVDLAQSWVDVSAST